MEFKKSSVSYSEIFKKAWQVAWHNRYLWWFGLFMALGGGGSYLNYSSGGKSEDALNEEKVLDFISKYMDWIIIAVLVIFALYIIFALLSVLARGALIASIDRHARGKKSNFKMGLKDGRMFFGRIFLVAVAIGLFLLAALIIMGVPIAFLFLNENYVIGAIMTIFAASILIVLAILAMYIKTFSYFYIVLGKLSFWSALENAYNLFRKNVMDSLVMGLLFIPLNALYMISVVAIALAVAIVFVGFGLILYLIAGIPGAIAVGAIALIIFLAGALLSESVYRVLAQALWYFFFQEIAKLKNEEEVAEAAPSPEPVPTKAMPVIEYREK